MLVKDCMTRHPIMIGPETLATEAQKIMTESNIRHLPVVGDGKILLGLITRQNLAMDPEAVGSLDMWDITRYLANLEVEALMVPREQVFIIQANKTAERAARIMMERKVGCLPVLDEDSAVVGILSEVDLLNAFQRMLALPTPGIRVTIRMPDQPGEFAKLSTALGRHGIGVMGIGTYPTPRREGCYDTVIKVRNVSEESVRQALEEIESQEIVDLRDEV